MRALGDEERLRRSCRAAGGHDTLQVHRAHPAMFVADEMRTPARWCDSGWMVDSNGPHGDQGALVARVAGLLADARRVTVLTGAGVSTDSGIPDFRGPQGVWTKNPRAERLATFQAYRDDPEVRRESWRQRLDHPVWAAKPGAAHHALVALESSGRLVALLTQNIDELHQAAGSSPGSVVELHGTVHHTECLTCAARAPMSEALSRVAAGEADPPCSRCGGILKSATISFGQNLNVEVLNRAREAAVGCDVMMAVGTSLGVHPAAGLVDLASAAGASVIIINAEPTPYDDIAEVVLRGGVGDLLPRLVEDLRHLE